MKKTYITPLATVETAEAERMMATSVLTPNQDNISVSPTDEDYDGEFNAKENTIDW